MRKSSEHVRVIHISYPKMTRKSVNKSQQRSSVSLTRQKNRLFHSPNSNHRRRLFDTLATTFHSETNTASPGNGTEDRRSGAAPLLPSISEEWVDVRHRDPDTLKIEAWQVRKDFGLRHPQLHQKDSSRFGCSQRFGERSSHMCFWFRCSSYFWRPSDHYFVRQVGKIVGNQVSMNLLLLIS